MIIGMMVMMTGRVRFVTAMYVMTQKSLRIRKAKMTQRMDICA